MYIVSDEILENLICSYCKRYLSVKPIKVYPNKGIKCGRCSNPFDAGVISLFGLLAEEAVFPCINRYDRCNQLLTYSDVVEHEKTCFGNNHECPSCIRPFTGTGYEMLIHFKETHPDRLIYASELVLDIANDMCRSYLYKKNDLLCFVNASYYRNENEIILNVSYLGTDQDAAQISQNFTLLSPNGQVVHKTKKKTCYSEKGANYFKVTIDKNDFHRNVVICKFDLNAENIRRMLLLPSTLQNAGTKAADKFNFNGFSPTFQFKKNFSKKDKMPISRLYPMKFGTGFDAVNGSALVGFPAISKPEWPKPVPDSFGSKEVPSFCEFLTFSNKPPITDIPYCPVVERDTTIWHGKVCSISTKLHCITVMTEYDKWSFEELRLSDYEANRKGRKS